MRHSWSELVFSTVFHGNSMKVIALILFIISLDKCFSANILAVTTLASPSHHIWHKSYFLALVKNGHNVTVLTHDEEEEKVVNFTVLTLEGVYDKIHKDFVLEDTVYNTPLQSILELADWDEVLCKYDLETNAVKTLLNYPQDYKFDLIIWDLNAGYCLYSLIDRFGTPPVIGTSPFGLQPHIAYILGNPIFSYVPFYQVSSGDRMDIIDRLRNFFYVHFMNLVRIYYSIPRENEIAKNYFGSNIRSIQEFERNVSLLLVNVDPVLNPPQPIAPNIIPVGGIHIKTVKELPQDIATILNKAKHGVIFVAFGTNLNIERIGADQRRAFIDAFKRLPQTILMKAPKGNLKFSSNVVTKEWLPQNDILAHPNVKLFVTHGGALSSQEAIYHGVPVVGMPFFLDQHGNMGKMVIKQVGKSIDYFNVTADLVYETIVEVINNPTYRSNMQAESKRFRDQPHTPLERALFWTEYLLRQGSSEHFSPATRDMLIFQKFDLDIAVVLFSIIASFIILVYIVIKNVCKLLQIRKAVNTSKLKRN